ncbi:MAG: response regulator [Candidatus Marinimicrobia bacterium]|nr:response regulator [Candidatus Neomarinimicrobiota bacterium]
MIFLSLRFLVMAPAAVMNLLWTYHRSYKKYDQLALFISNLVGALVIMIMIFIAEPPVTYLYYAGEILVIIYAFTFSGLRFIWSLALGLLVIFIYQMTAIINDTPVLYIVNNNFFFISANFLTLTASYIIESTMRNDFYSSRLLKIEKEKVSELNKNLEKTVLLRTQQLEQINQKLIIELNKSNELYNQQKALQEQLVQSQKMQAIGYLAGGVAHDFNNLLTVINGYAEILLNEIAPESKYYDPIDQILQAGGKAADLVRQLLAFSRKQVMHPEIIDMNHLIKNFEKMIIRLIETHIQLDFQYLEEPIKIEVDPRQLEQVILNLVVNARDAMPKGGKLTLKTATVEISEDNNSRFEKNEKGKFAVLSVSDQGTGMDENTLNHIFEPFFTTKVVGKGTGLGLSTVYGIIAQSQGTVYVNSKPGEGTEFTILLPLQDQELIEEEIKIEFAMDYHGKGIILIIEDNNDVRSYLEVTLNYFGYDTLAAHDYDEAFPIFKQLNANIDLVISDVMLPGISGEKIIEKFRLIKKDLKFIIISGYANEYLKDEDPIATGNFLPKPFNQKQLMEKVKNHLSH